MPAATIILASEFWNGAAGRGFAHAFRELGHDVHEVDLSGHFLRSRARDLRLVGRALQRLGRARYNAAILALAAKVRPDVLFTVKGVYIEPKTLRTLRAQGVRCIIMFPDVDFDHSGLNFESMRCYDLIATTKTFHLPYLAQQGMTNVIHVDHGFSPLTHRPVRDAAAEAERWDISYVGNASRHKLDWLCAVARAFPDKRFGVFGDGWSKLAGNTTLAPFVQGFSTMGDNFARTVGESKINLAIHFGPVGKFGWEDAVSSRSFHIPASGGFMLHIDNPEIRRLYDVPGEIDTFATAEELNAKIAFYLEHDDLRRDIAARGHRRCVENYSLMDRAATILDHAGMDTR